LVNSFVINLNSFIQTAIELNGLDWTYANILLPLKLLAVMIQKNVHHGIALASVIGCCGCLEFKDCLTFQTRK
jgi:hypothetical protein